MNKVERDNVDREATNFRLLEVFLHFALNTSQFRVNLQQERIVLERSARLNLDPGKGDLGDGGDK